MALAPHLATLTYASPHLILSHAVPGSVLRPLKIRPPVATPATVTTTPKTVEQTEPLLVKPIDEDAWRVLPADDHQVLDAEVSDAKLCATPAHRPIAGPSRGGRPRTHS